MKNTYLHIVVMILVSAMLAIFVASCGTVRGFGKDVGKAGEHIEASSR